jgi:N6-adenosine-specific RNA methylase IME4
MTTWPFGHLERGKYGAILADPPWHFQPWVGGGGRWNGNKDKPVYTPARAPAYGTMTLQEIKTLPVANLATTDCLLLVWGVWYYLPQVLEVIAAWGFEYKTCAFCWQKADVSQPDMFKDQYEGQWGLGYWVRQNTEFCLLATRGSPKRLNATVQQGIIAPRREHSRKPDGVHERIERLVAGPYVELFARQKRPGWDCWGNETDKFAEVVE